jgi:hypothetical protein
VVTLEVDKMLLEKAVSLHRERTSDHQSKGKGKGADHQNKGKGKGKGNDYGSHEPARWPHEKKMPWDGKRPQNSGWSNNGGKRAKY